MRAAAAVIKKRDMKILLLLNAHVEKHTMHLHLIRYYLRIRQRLSTD